MEEYRVEGHNAVLIGAALDQRRELERQTAILMQSIEARLREMNNDLPEKFGINIDGGAIVAYWEEEQPDEGDVVARPEV